MRQILIAAGMALAVALLLTLVLIRVFTRLGFGQEIRDDAPMSHQRKRGTPTMGGLAILTAIWASYLGTNLVGLALGGEGPSASGLLVLGWPPCWVRSASPTTTSSCGARATSA